MRVEIRGAFTELHATTQITLTQQQIPHRYGLLAVCTPFVPPIQSDILNEDPILKTKHALDMSLMCADSRFKQIVEVEEIQSVSFYDLIHPNDVKYVSEAHSAGLFQMLFLKLYFSNKKHFGWLDDLPICKSKNGLCFICANEFAGVF